VLSLEFAPTAEPEQGHAEAEARVAAAAGIAARGRAADAWLLDTARLTWRVKLHLSLTLDLFTRAREAAEEEAIRVFGDNLKDLMLAAPAGSKTVMGLDPGIRTGVKVAVVDATGKLLATTTVYPHEPRRQWDQSLAELGALCLKHGVELIAIGNGTASRETDKLAGELIKKIGERAKISKIVVSEAGASVYSASELAAKEFPDLDVSLRGAVSIARRLQDPLAELVKIEPKAIGVGQYQHDVNQYRLARARCARGGLRERRRRRREYRVRAAARARRGAVVERRRKHRQIPRRARRVRHACGVEESAAPRRQGVRAERGLLRIAQGADPLDASGVHPEAYPVVERIIKNCGREVKALIGDGAFLRSLRAEDYTDERFGVPTVRDILRELEKPGRDPRPDFVAPTFAEGVEDVKDLVVGMVLEGRVTNVAAFGAFVDIGVHQDGLVHVSALSHTFVRDPREAVKAGDIVKVKVMEVDLQRQRIALSMRLDDVPGEARSARESRGERGPSSAPRGPRRASRRRNLRPRTTRSPRRSRALARTDRRSAACHAAHDSLASTHRDRGEHHASNRFVPARHRCHRVQQRGVEPGHQRQVDRHVDRRRVESYGKRWTCDAALKDGDQVCRKSAAVDEFPRLQNENFANHHVAIAYRFHDGKLVQIRVERIDKGWFNDFLDALKKQYGEPKLENGTAQDKSGKSFERTTARWEDGNAALRLSTNTPAPPAVDLVLYDAEYFATQKAADSAAKSGDG
jgi:uncharacterized protein